MFGPYYNPSIALVLPNTGGITSQLYGVAGMPSAPSAASLAAVSCPECISDTFLSPTLAAVLP